MGVALACRARSPVPDGWTYPLDARPEHGSRGMVVSDAAVASQVGIDVLAAGGNAVDAAVAMAFALAVVLPEAGNLGGGGFAIVRLGGPNAKAAALDFREVSPASTVVDPGGAATRLGARAAAVPGTVAGLFELHRRFGTRPWAELLGPAIDLAERGFAVTPELVRSVVEARWRLERNPAAAAWLLPGGRPVTVGARLQNGDLAATLRRIASGGVDGFAGGPTAALIEDELASGGGAITASELRAYRPVWRESLIFAYGGRTFATMPAPSWGGAALAQTAVLFGNAAGLEWHSRPHIERLIAAMRQTISGGGGAHTTHLSVVDADGGAVALTTTLNELYGCGVLVRGAGFFLNDEMDSFRGRVEAGARPPSAMTPVIGLDAAGAVVIVAGARGGPRIPTAVFQVISNVVDFGMNAAAAVSAPRVHTEAEGVSSFEDGGFDAAAVRGLTARTLLGGAPFIVRRGAGWEGFADPRHGGAALGR